MRTLKANTFEIGFLEGWQDNSQIVLVGPARPTFSPNVQVTQEPVPTNVTASEYFAMQRGDLAAQLDGFQLLEQGDRLLAGQPADYHVYTWMIPQGVRIRQLQIATVRGGTLYTVTCSAMDVDWPNFEAAFDMTLAGFKFTT